ncbi:M56 family metallopeptidase [Gimesia algae]|uniref:Regulatory protein BlaR1 n=1 Tax=Gimesia algae TaxID=2527971 RepID=A0A517VGP6_9PLAN|nr:M56 family metallopeptidase [Gimesia algae]QDT92183.1 Regulatory protein BlaR1 [Gimesia algae]
MYQISNQWILFLLDVSTKALLLAAIAGIALKLFKLQDSNLRHRIWSGVLAGMLLLPLLTLALPTISLSLPASWTNFQSNVKRTPAHPTPVVSNNMNPSGPVVIDSVPLENREMQVSQTENVPHPKSQYLEATDASTPVADWSFPQLTQLIPGALLIFWSAVSLLFASRLIAGLWSSSRILRRATMIDGPQLLNCLVELPPAILKHIPAIRESQEVLVPVTVGWVRPTVLLPEEWQTWSDEKLTAIVAHEFTHVARRDFFVTLAAELNRCLYWFHPVSWWLRTRLSDLAEEACDDAAISHTGDRTGYARHLLEVATSLRTGSGQRVTPGVSMARTSNVESRITTILDFKRPLSQHLTWRSTTAIAVIATFVIIVAAAIHPTSVAATPAEQPVATESTTDSTDTETVHIQGQVTDTSDNPIPGTRVRLYRMQRPKWHSGSNTATLLTELKVDREGRFDQTVAKNIIIQERKNHESGQHLSVRHMWWTVLVVSAPNYAYSTFRAEQSGPIINGKSYLSPGFLNQPFTVQLRPAVTIHGRLLSIEGQPVEGVNVSVFQLRRPHASRFDAWLQQTSKAPLPKSDNRAIMLGGSASQYTAFPCSEFHLPLQCVPPVVTNSSGSFELSGLAAKDDLVILRINGQGITDTVIHVLACDMKPVYGRPYAIRSESGAYYGRTFDFITQPSVPVYGVVRDIETRQPLAGIPVAVSVMYGSTIYQKGYISTKTDQQGRYRIEGLPIPPVGTGRYDRNRLAVRPGKLPYIETDSLSVPRGDGVNPVEFNIEFRRAVIARGRITDKTTGEPIAAAEIYYSPYAKNENCDQYLRYSDGSRRLLGNHDTRYLSDAHGYFEIPVIPGRGVIGATINEGEYIPGFGAQKIEAYRGKDPSQLPNMLSDSLVPSLFHSLKEIDAPVDKPEFELSMYVDPGITLTINFVDPQGKPVKGVWGNGLNGSSQGKAIQDDHAQATGLAIGKIRAMDFTDNTNNLTRLLRLIPEKGQTHFTFKLFPPSRLTGRLIAPEGRPLTNTFLETRHQNDPYMIGSLPETQTDNEGRFDYTLPTGTNFKILARTDNNYFIIVKDLENPMPKNIDLGDLIIDPEAKSWSQAKAKREPIITELISKVVDDQAPESGTQE